MAKQRKMVNLSVEETSGVDHPAHLHEGWVILKSADQAEVAEVIESLAAAAADNTEESMSDEKDEVVETEAVETPETPEVDAELAKAHERIAELEAALAAKSVDPEPQPEAEGEEALLKSVPDAVREMIAKAKAEADTVREELRKEREARQDKEFTEKVAAWKSLTLDAAEFGPLLRKLTAVAPELADKIEKALASLDAQVESANIFAEIGTAANKSVSGDAYSKIESLAKAKVAAGEVSTVEQGIASVIAANPDLYTDYLAEQRA